MEDKIAIVGIGCTTPVGYSAKETAASVRSGINRFQEITYYDRVREPFIMSCLPTEAMPFADPVVSEFPNISAREVRLLQLAGTALSESIANIPETDKFPVFLGMPEPNGEDASQLDSDFFNLLSFQSSRNFDYLKSKLYPIGRASSVFALSDAINLLNANETELVVVGGCDSYWDYSLLKKLDHEGRICTSVNLDGFVPGEGAGFVSLCLLKTATQRNFEVLGIIGGVSTGFEYGYQYSDEPHKGSGLSDTFSSLFSEYPTEDPINTAYVCINGESYHSKDWGVAYIRNSDRFSDDVEVIHPADCLGDTGAATGVVMAILATIGLSKEYIYGPCIVSCSSDFGNCGAFTLMKSA